MVAWRVANLTASARSFSAQAIHNTRTGFYHGQTPSHQRVFVTRRGFTQKPSPVKEEASTSSSASSSVASGTTSSVSPKKPFKSSPLLIAGSIVGVVVVGGAIYQLNQFLCDRAEEFRLNANACLEQQEAQQQLQVDARQSRNIDASATKEIDRRLQRGEMAFYPKDLSPKSKPTADGKESMTKKNTAASDLYKKRVLRVDTNSLPAYQIVEDRWSVHNVQEGTLVGVYDGHLQHNCAELLSDHLPSAVAHSLLNARPSYWSRIYHSMFGRWFGNDSGQEQWYDLNTKVLVRAITDAFVEMDQSIAKRAQSLLPKNVTGIFREELEEVLKDDYVKETLWQAVAGSCAVMAYVNDGRLLVASTGDSRATLGHKLPNGHWKAIRISTDQSPKDPKIVKRLQRAHPGEENTVVIDGRVLGALGTAGAFGDAIFKWPIQYHDHVFPALLPKNRQNLIKGIKDLYFTPPYVSAIPDVATRKLRQGDRFLIVASDGLWNELEEDTAVQIVGDWIDNGMQSSKLSGKDRQRKEQEAAEAAEAESDSGKAEKPFKPLHRRINIKDENGATHLLRHALGGGDANRLARMLSGGSGMHLERDDITIHVVVFSEDIKVGGDAVVDGETEVEARTFEIVFPQEKKENRERGCDMRVEEMTEVDLQQRELPTRSHWETLVRELE